MPAIRRQRTAEQEAMELALGLARTSRDHALWSTGHRPGATSRINHDKDPEHTTRLIMIDGGP